MKKLLLFGILSSSLVISGCFKTDAQVASQNLSTAADQFEVMRRIVFFNGITDKYVMSLEGRCSINHDGSDNQLEVTCATGPSKLKKHYFGLSDNTAYFVEQLGFSDVSKYHYRVIFKPQSIIPNVDFEGSSDAFVKDMTK